MQRLLVALLFLYYRRRNSIHIAILRVGQADIFSTTSCAQRSLAIKCCFWDQRQSSQRYRYGMPSRSEASIETTRITKTKTRVGFRDQPGLHDNPRSPDMHNTLLRLPEVLAITRRSKAQIYRDAASGTFPRPVKIGARASAWRCVDVQAWLDNLAPAHK